MEEKNDNIIEEKILEEEILEEEILEEDGQAVLSDSPIKNIPTLNVVEEKVKIQTNGKPFNELSNLEKIKFASAQMGVETLEPKKSCKHCYGTGIISVRKIEDPTYKLTSGTEGIDGLIEEVPNPCRCIFKKQDLPKMFTGNFPLTKKMEKLQYKKLRKISVSKSPKALSEKQRLLIKKMEKKKTKKKLRKKFNRRNK